MKVKNIKTRFSSITFRLFSILIISTVLIVSLIVLVNNFALRYIYQYTQSQTAQKVYAEINKYYTEVGNEDAQISQETLRQLEIKYNMDFYILNEKGVEVYSSRKDSANAIANREKREPGNKALFQPSDERIVITENEAKGEDNKYMSLTGKLDNGYTVYVRVALFPVQESMRISNQTLILIGLIIIIISLIVTIFLSRNFTYPIVRMTGITNKMANLDFSEKYRITDSNDEINALGRNINMMSDKLEKTIDELKKNNNELERDIREKTKIDEMRKQFISDVSHELKTPIALIQGYSEGLIENVNNDEESRKFYAEVIADEAGKMDKMVKQLLELMKIEHQEGNFEDQEFDLRELINEEIKRETVVLEEKNIQVVFNNKKKIPVYSNEVYTEQVVTNFITNAIKHAEEKNGKKEIVIRTEKQKDKKIRLYVYNTGEKIDEEYIEKIWDRFYKIDSSREREKGGTGIGLSLVKAIMDKYKNKYGVENVDNGVEFYCDINTK